MNIIIKMDFLNDWREYLRHQLMSSGYIPNENPNKISIQYFNLLKRGVTLTPRKIYFSKEFVCPEEQKEGLELIIKKVKSGENLAANLSKKITRIDYKDPLLNDWNIHHLHLGSEIDKDGFVKRTGPLLFIRFERTAAYFINIYNHGNWSNLDLVRIIHNNWPQLIEKYRIDDVSAGSSLKTDKEVSDLRKIHSVSLIEPYPGVIYLPIGMGMTTSGDSIEVIQASYFYHNYFNELEGIISESLEEIVNTAESQGTIINTDLHFKLVIENYKVKAIDEEYNIRLDLGDLP